MTRGLLLNLTVMSSPLLAQTPTKQPGTAAGEAEPNNRRVKLVKI